MLAIVVALQGGIDARFAVITAAVLLVVSSRSDARLQRHNMLLMLGVVLMVLMMIRRREIVADASAVEIGQAKESGRSAIVAVNGLMMRFGGAGGQQCIAGIA